MADFNSFGYVGQGNYLTINDDGLILQLDATERFDRTSSAKVTSQPISKGKNVGDNYSVNNRTLAFNGVVSDDKVNFVGFLSNIVGKPNNIQPNAAAYVAAIDKIFEEKRTVSIVLPDGIAFNEAVITKLSVSRSKEYGNGFKISINAEEMQQSEKGLLKLKEPKPEAEDAVAKTDEAKGDSPKREPRKGGFTQAFGGVFGFTK